MPKYLKHIFLLITIILMCVSFISCSNNGTDETKSTLSSAITAETAAETTIKTIESETTAEEITTCETGTPSNNTKNTTRESSSANTVAESTTKKSIAETTSTVTGKSNITTKANSTQTATTNKAVVSTTTTASTFTCTVEIECKKILSNMDNLKAGHEDFVPANGIILNTCTVTVDSGDTVYDALKTVCNKNGIIINSKSSAYGIYISGFNNIDEMDCGKQSGWLYQVNGKTPPKSCSKYTVSPGDKIVFSYTC